MINNDLFTTTVIMFVLTIISVLFLGGVAAWCGFDIYQRKAGNFWQVKVSSILLILFVLYFGIPFWLLAAAYNVKDVAKAERFYNLAIQTSIFPSVKSLLYSEKGAYYSMTYNGAKAIDAYEKAYEIKKDDTHLHQLCLLYTIKGDYDKAVGTCVQTSHNQMAAINSIINKNYQLALNVINMEFKDENPSCWDYAVRGYIYRELNRKDLSEVDFAKAFELCPNNSRLNQVYENSNYYDEYYANLRKNFHF